MDSKVILSEKNPNDTANLISKLFLTWSFPLFKRGYSRPITISDLWQARESDLSGRLGDRLEEAWNDEIEKAHREGGKPSLSKAIVRSFWLEYMLCGIFVGILFIVLWPLMPYTLALFIGYFSGERTPETYRLAHIYGFSLNLISALTSLLMNHTLLSQNCVGMRVRIAACSLMYRKILKLDRIGMSKTEPGQVINLMSNDVSRFDLLAQFLNYLWVMPIVVPVVTYLVWEHVGWATFGGLAVIILQTVLVQAYLSQRQGILRGKIAKRTDERVRVMSELVSGVQVIKMYAWEKPFEKLVDTLRKVEIKYIKQTSMIKGFSTALMVFTERFILFTTIVIFVLLGGDIRSEITFSLVQYFNLLQLACNICVPMAMSFLAETKVSIRRVEEFLMLDEISSENEAKPYLSNIANGFDSNYKKEKESTLKPTAVVLSNVSASWQPDSGINALKNISLTIPPGEFLGVAGLVGSGKSSLLHLLLGELPPSEGKLSMGKARISYASQEPWLFVASVKQNILFGLPYDPARYKKVVTACSLLRDFQQLPNGDATLVGERGASLSGGQRARVGLARACYRQADIYLLDDPLSAVDTHVGKELVSNCVMGLLRHSTRILVTHQLHHLKGADRIAILRNGVLEREGTFEEVSSTSLFDELVEEKEEKDEPGRPPSFMLRQRTMSVQSHTSVSTVNEIATGENEEQEEEDEISGSGRVSPSVYAKYFRAGGSWCLLLFTVLSIIAAQVVTSVNDLWLTYWMNNVERMRIARENEAILRNSTSLNDTNIFNYTTSAFEVTTSSFDDITISPTQIPVTSTEGLNDSMTDSLASTAYNMMGLEALTVDHTFYIYVWTFLVVCCIIFTTGRSVIFLWVCMKSSINLHNQMFSNILSATMRFFDTNPSGRILNRFSKDMGTVDEILPRMYLETIQVIMVMLGILVMVAIVSPFMLLTTCGCAVLMYIWTVIYLNTAQAVKRVEGVARSPVFSHVSASMAGLATVRANDAQELLKKQFDDKQDIHTAAWYLTLVTNTTFVVWLTFISGLYIIIVSYTFLLSDDGNTRSGNVGLALSQGLILVNLVSYGIKQSTEVVSQMTSVERVVQFTSLPQEKTDGPSPPKDWPQKAKLVFKDLSLRYDTESEPVLKNLDIVIESGWKVGVVGRTGAGKSSLISALFRLAPIEGDVYIDNVETGKIALKDLRSKISIIPQEPVLFSASLRYNLDPFDKYTDAEIWSALEQVELKKSVTSLSSNVESGGTNFSAGQRQLLCLARAALARNKLLVLDEATANVDPNTDTLIQKSIRKYFSDCTVLTVAHRLHTVADSDRVVVMEAGRIVECGHPHELLQNADGHFSGMVRQLSPAAAQSLRELARHAHAEHVLASDTKDKTQ